MWEPPRLFFDSSVSRQTVQQLTEIVKRHQVREREGGGDRGREGEIEGERGEIEGERERVTGEGERGRGR